jgi:hypothetical protein
MAENLKPSEEEKSQTKPIGETREKIEPKDFPVICSWCKKEKGRSTVENSHGICDDCAKEWPKSGQKDKEIAP